MVLFFERIASRCLRTEKEQSSSSATPHPIKGIEATDHSERDREREWERESAFGPDC